MTRHEIAEEACRRLSNFPSRSIARYLIDEYGGLFENDLEKARDAVRYVRGSRGEKGRRDNDHIIPPAGEIKIPQTWRKITTPHNLSPGKWLTISDIHVPFHETKPIEAAIKHGKKTKCTGIFLNGDIQDCQAETFWPSVTRKNFLGEVMAVIDFLDYLRQQFPDAEIVYKPGNHEYRLPRYYASHAPETIGNPAQAMESLIDFEGRRIEFLDYFQKVMAGKLPIFHGHEFRNISSAVNPARGLFLRTKKWALCAHMHRTSEHTDTNVDDEYLTTWSIGCLCDLHPEYNPFGSNWNWGFAVIEVDDKGNFEVSNKRILANGKVV